MANVTESAAIATPEQTRPQRVTIYGRDSSDGTLRPISVGTDGQLQLNLTGEALALDVSVDGLEAGIGIVTESAPANITASSGLNGLLRFLGGLTGAVVETSPANDTASSGLNGRLQRIAQRLTTAIASLDLLAPTTTAGAGIAPVVTSALATGLVVKASAGNLYRLNGAATTVAGFFLVHNATAVPAAGAVTPVKAFPVGIGQAIAIDFDPPLRCGTGISVSFSSATTTPFTQTDSATAFISVDAV